MAPRAPLYPHQALILTTKVARCVTPRRASLVAAAAALLGNNQGDSHVSTELFGNSPDPCATIFKALFTDHANKKLHNTMEHTLDLYYIL
jgi:hypothetical protein